MRDRDLRSEDLAALADRSALLEMEWPPCRTYCPVHADVRAYIELAARGQWKAAVDVIREALPFASVCGRICHHPCEDNCRRCDVDEAVAIREIKRFVAERIGADATVKRPERQDRGRVAIVGAGPAGLSAALELARAGYAPEVFEKFPVAGGIPATAVPPYRLPREVLRQDVDWICAHGVQVHTGVEIGKERTIEQLLADGFDAVLIATGLAASRMLDLPGIDHPRVHPVLDFLTDLAFGRRPDVGEDVLVIGGGNVAMDAGRSAIRLGARRVRAMCLENEEEMPAWDWERDEAVEEGVEIIHRRGPTEIAVEDGRIVGVSARKVTRVFDEQDRFAPRYDDADVITLDCDTVVFAIGQQADLGFTAGSGLETTGPGRLAYEPATHRTSREGVFACGEIVTVPGSVVEACASGRRAARAIDLYLRGEPIEIDETLPPEIGRIDEATAEKVKPAPRNAVRMEPPDVRRTNFRPVDHTYDEATVLREARRCMSCGGGAEVLVDKCTACLTCLRVCPFDIPAVTDVARIDSALCQACGMCIADCPGNAIIARSWSVEELRDETRAKLAADTHDVMAYICGHHAPAAAWSGEEPRVPGVAELYLPSMSRLSAATVLHALRAGARGVIVVACHSGADRYPNATERITKRLQQVRELLGEIGLPAEKVQLLTAADQGRAALREAMAQAAEQIRQT